MFIYYECVERFCREGTKNFTLCPVGQHIGWYISLVQLLPCNKLATMAADPQPSWTALYRVLSLFVRNFRGGYQVDFSNS